jgi:hypothetical protein
MYGVAGSLNQLLKSKENLGGTAVNAGVSAAGDICIGADVEASAAAVAGTGVNADAIDCASY